jgi:hypothetical protein
MQSINDPTIISFEFAPDDQTRLAPSIVAELVALMEQSCSTILGPYFPGVRAKMWLIESPTRGSLLFQFAVDIVATAFDPSTFSPAARESLQILANEMTVGGVAWVVLFGGRGILDLFKRPPSNASVLPKSSQDLSVIALEIIATEQFEDHGKRVLQQLRLVASNAGAIEVSVILPDQSRVVIWSGLNRRSGELLSRIAMKAQGRNIIGPLRRRSTELLRVELNGKTYPCFLAEAYDQTRPTKVVVIWTSSRPIPEVDVDTDARYYPLHDRPVEPLDKIPPYFDDAISVIVVTGAAEYM